MIRTLLLVVAAVAVTTSACASEVDLAFDYATQHARDAAERDRLRVEAVARKAGARDPEAALGAAVAGDPERVFGNRITADGFELDAVYHGQGQAGGGWTAESRTVRLCVRFTARLDPRPEVKASDVACPDSLPALIPEFERTVRLTD